MLHLLIAVTFSLSVSGRLKLLLTSHLKSGLYLYDKKERQISGAFPRLIDRWHLASENDGQLINHTKMPSRALWVKCVAMESWRRWSIVLEFGESRPRSEVDARLGSTQEGEIPGREREKEKEKRNVQVSRRGFTVRIPNADVLLGARIFLKPLRM